MNWIEAKELIKRNIQTGADINTSRSRHREVIAVDVPVQSRNYNFSENGIIVKIGLSGSATEMGSRLEQ